jgi:hypothetical protein
VLFKFHRIQPVHPKCVRGTEVLVLAFHLAGLNEPFCTVFRRRIGDSIIGSRMGSLPNQTANHILELGLALNKVVPVPLPDVHVPESGIESPSTGGRLVRPFVRGEIKCCGQRY